MDRGSVSNEDSEPSARPQFTFTILPAKTGMRFRNVEFPRTLSSEILDRILRKTESYALQPFPVSNFVDNCLFYNSEVLTTVSCILHLEYTKPNSAV